MEHHSAEKRAYPTEKETYPNLSGPAGTETYPNFSDLSEILSPREKLSLCLRAVYEKAGFVHYRMGRFEEYGLYRENQRFLADERVITFTDLDGRFMALKPDVTLSIAKNASVAPGTCGRYYYEESVYRPERESGTFREIHQMGVECIGAADTGAAAETLALAVHSLKAAGRPWALELGSMEFVRALFDACAVPPEIRPDLLRCIRRKNFREMASFVTDQDSREKLCLLETLSGDWDSVLEQAEKLLPDIPALSGLRELRERLSDMIPPESVRLDLSLVNDMEYYNGFVFQGFWAGMPRPVLRGGEYGPLAEKFHPGAKAVGFALYLDELDRPYRALNRQNYTLNRQNHAPEQLYHALNRQNDTPEQSYHDGQSGTDTDSLLNIALPKGRLGDKVYRLLAAAGCAAPEYPPDSRRLVLENPAAGIRCFLVKPSDVAIYVEHGAADVGIAGKDILEESGADVYELLDTGLGKCRMCVAGREDFTDSPGQVLRVATKFTKIAKNYFAGQGREIDLIHLNGSIELAPLLNLSDVIVDIVETGTTLKENHLRVITEFMPVSARLIANRASYQFKRNAIETLRKRLREAAEV